MSEADEFGPGGMYESGPNTETATTIFDAIERNQELWRKTLSPRKRHRLCLKNQELFEQVGIEFPPMDEPRGIYGWWLRIRGGQARPEA